MVLNTLNEIKRVVTLDFSYNQKHMLAENKVQACALFEVQLEYGEGGMIKFKPEARDMQGALQTVTIEGFDCVKMYRPFLQQEMYSKYNAVAIKDDIFNDYNDMLTLALSHDDLMHELSLIYQGINQGYSLLTEHTLTYKKPIKIYNTSLSFNVNDSRNME